MNTHTNSNCFFSGALIGGTVATLVTMLFTTKKGQEIQHRISEKYEDMKDSAKEKYEDMKDSAKDTAHKVKREAEK